MSTVTIVIGSWTDQEPVLYTTTTNPLLAGLIEFEADPEKWFHDLTAFVDGDFFPFADDVLDALLTDHDLTPHSGEVQHAWLVLGRVTGNVVTA